MPGERILKARLKFGIDRQTAEATKRGVADVEKGLKKTEEQARKTREAMNRLRESAERFGQVGMTLTGVGASITGPLLLAANNYVKSVGQAESTSRAWLAATKDLERSQIRIGRVVAKEALPFLEKAADLAEKAAKFAEDHPDAIKAALEVGTVLTALGTATMVAGQLVKTVATIGSFAPGLIGLLGGGGGAAASGAGAATGGVASLPAWSTGAAAAGGGLTIGGVGLAAAGGVLAGGAGYEAIRALAPGMNLPGLGEFAGVGAYEATKLFGGGEAAAQRNLVQVAGALGVLDAAAQKAAEGGLAQMERQVSDLDTAALRRQERELGVEDIYPGWGAAVAAFAAREQEKTAFEQQYESQRVQLIRQYGQQRVAAEAQYESSRTKAIRDFGIQQREAQSDYDRNRVQALRDFRRSERETETQYYKERTVRAAAYSKEVQRMEADHQRSMERMQEDHDVRLEDAIVNRDAIAFLQEQRGYEVQRRRAEEDYSVQAAQRSEDYAQQTTDAETAFAEQRSQRQDEFARQLDEQARQFEQQQQRAKEHQDLMLTDMEQAHKDQMDLLDAQNREALNNLEVQHKEESRVKEAAFSEHIRQLLGIQDTFQAEMTRKTEAGLKEMVKRLENSLPTYSTAGVYHRPGRQAGGYAAGFGAYTLGEGGPEFVLSAATTAAAERALGLLDQEKLLAALSGRGGRGGAEGLTQYITFPPDSGLNEQMVASLVEQKTVVLLRQYAEG